MLKVGLTGGIGSGKSVIARIFGKLGIPVFNADEKARELTMASQEIQSKVRTVFGDDIFDNGILNRGKLAKIVFNDENKLRKLNEIIHPEVEKEFESWLTEQGDCSYILKEAAIMFESGSNRNLDKIITVQAPEKLRIDRVMARDVHRSKDDIMKIIRSQLRDDERAERSDFIIVNDDHNPLLPQVLELDKILSNEDR